jgi:hypothetical protein
LIFNNKDFVPWTLLVLATLIDIFTWLPDFDETGVAVILDIAKAAMAEAGVVEGWLELAPVDDEVEVPEEPEEVEEDEDEVVVVGVVVVVVVAAAPMVTEYVVLAVCDAESARRTAKLYVPMVVGVPEITPALLSESPAGRLPEESAQVYEPDPPEADRDVE